MLTLIDKIVIIVGIIAAVGFYTYLRVREIYLDTYKDEIIKQKRRFWKEYLRFWKWKY